MSVKEMINLEPISVMLENYPDKINFYIGFGFFESHPLLRDDWLIKIVAQILNRIVLLGVEYLIKYHCTNISQSH